MQTLELASRLIKRWDMSLGNMPADVQQSLLDCINAGIQDFYAEAPSIYRQAPFGGVLGAPQEVTLGATNGSQVFTGFTASTGSYFSTIRIQGDTSDNLVLPPSGLLNPYQGQTGSQLATLYDDTIPLPSNIERIIDEPTVMGHRYRLARNDEYWGCLWGDWGAAGGFFLGPYVGSGERRRTGIPRTYWVEPNAVCLGGVPQFVIRVDPMPSAATEIRGRALFYPLKLTMGNLQVNTAVPLNDAWMESMLIPIILAKMTEDDLWKNKANIAMTLKSADTARARVKALAPFIEKPNSRVETAPGF
jgi:hypothetical protein